MELHQNFLWLSEHLAYCENYEQVIRACRNCYLEITSYSRKHDLETLLSHYYRIGRECGVIFVHFDQFRKDWYCSCDWYLADDRGFVDKWRQFHYENRGQRAISGKYFRATQKYVRNIGHKKKERDTDKQIWRSKIKCGSKGKRKKYCRGPGRYYKRLASSLSRTISKRLIKNDRHEDIIVHEKRYMIIDPWSWD